ncbi:MAG: TIGR03987 family protein [Chloroflexi bacterium]|nr:MAG: TIGR03987 family protein [Chloroflexota bacterium]
MSTVLVFAIICMVTALIGYSIGVWSEKLAGILQGWHLVFFWIGLAFDTIGTALMGRIADTFSLNMHSALGGLAVILMLVHAVWATVIITRNDVHAATNFHQLSIFVWLVWLIPFGSGLLLAMG